MSIPPLYCSTPPPPEQCEDDKDHEDYDFQYNIQPDEDEDGLQYNYCHYSARDIYEKESDNIEKVTTCENIDAKIMSQDKPLEEVIYCGNVNSTTKVSIADPEADNPEENAVEDLNLMVSAMVMQANNSSVNKCVSDTDILDKDSCEETSIQDQGGTDPTYLSEANKDIFAIPIGTQLSNTNEDFKLCENNLIENAVDSIIPVDDVKISVDSPSSSDPTFNKVTTFSIAKDNLDTPIEPVVDDEFGDFDNFQFTSSENAVQYSNDTLESPWENRVITCSDQEDFQANFDDFQTIAIEETEKDLNPTENIVICETEIDRVVSDDDFGEFDDFQSSENNSSDKVASEELISANDILNIPLSNSDSQIENVNSVLTSIFVEDITEPDTELDVKLESILGETWGHLIDTDVRQPYMVYWNNSLGQKIMLKALCIDSRNILFGPKWNMPKYALNLGTAPLQPQKQQSHLHIPNTESNEKTTGKDSNTWTDPFTPQGQEYTYAEALLLDLEHLMATLDQMAHKNSTLQISELLSHACSTESEKPVVKSKDLETFTSELPSNINKIYSSTLSVQPLRQINLPDTHIFTPTDSETPRSKTIHYDSSPTNVAGKSDLEVNDSISPPINSSPQLSTEPVTNSLSDNEDDFQCFKGNTDTNINSVHNEKAVLNSKCDNVVTSPENYKTQLLQPIKLEPVIPTLNWPDPGEVKETFYDFSDFVSSTSWSDGNHESSSNHDSQTSTVKMDSIVKNGKTVSSPKIENNEDEFETFQSAPTPSTSNLTFQNVTQLVPTRSATSPSKIDNLNNPNLNIESDIDKRLHEDRPNNPPLTEANKITNNRDIITPSSVVQSSYQINCSDILQPSNAGASGTLRSQQNSVQILQPLSLESFSQINWPNPGIDLQDLSRFNPIESVHSLKSDSSGPSKVTSPIHNSVNIANKEVSDDDIWGDFVSSAPKTQPPTSKTLPTFADDDEWTDFVSSPNIKPQNGLSTISLNVHTNLNLQKSNHIKYPNKNKQLPLDIPTLNYITPKSNSRSQYTEKHFQNL